MKKSNNKVAKTFWAMLVVFSMVFTASPAAFAEGGFGASLEEAISDFQQSLPSIFHELSSEDVGVKPRIKPHFGATSTFTSDANLGESQDDPAWLARVSSGVTLEMPIGPRLYTEADYTFSYATVQGRKSNEHTITHNISALANYMLTDDTTIGLNNTLGISEVPGQGGDLFTLNTTQARISHKFSEILTVNIDDTLQYFNDRSSDSPTNFNNSFLDNGVGGSIIYDPTERITVTPNFRWNVREFDQIDGKDYWSINTALNLAYKVGQGTTVGGHFGWNYRKFDTGPDQGNHNLVWGASLNHSISRKLSWSADYSHSIQDTFDTSFVFRDTAEATNLDNLNRHSRLLKTDRIGTRGIYYFDERNTFEVFGDIQFIEGDAEDNVIALVDHDETQFELGVKYAYRINRYMSLDLRYVFGKRISSDDSTNRSDYTFHKAGGGLTINV